MKAVITVVGKDRVGILARISGTCAESGANVVDVTQSVLEDLLVMVMLVTVPEGEGHFQKLKESVHSCGETMGMQVNVMHEDIFNSMHRI